MKLFHFGLFFVAGFFLATPLFADNTAETSRIWKHHIESWGARDLPAILSDYTDESIVFLHDKQFRGPTQIRLLFEDLFKLFSDKDSQTIVDGKLHDRIVYITWRAKIEGKDYPVGTDTFVIEKGKIIYQTIASDPDLFRHLRRPQ